MKLPPWLWRFLTSRWCKRLGLALLVLSVVGIPAFYGIANAWGKHRFDAEVASLKAEGFPVTLDEALGPVPAVDDDAFEQPDLKDEMRQSGFGPMHPDTRSLLRGQLTLGTTSDPGRSADSLCPANSEVEYLRRELSRCQPWVDRFERAMEALKRPAANLHPDRIDPLGRREVLERQIEPLADFVTDLALIRLAIGDTNGAFKAAMTIFDLEKTVVENHPLFADVVLLRVFEQSAYNVIWEGVAGHCWNDEQLAEFQRRLDGIDPREVAVCALRAEMAAEITHTKRLGALPDHDRDYPPWRLVGEDLLEGIKERKMDRIEAGLESAWFKARPWGLDQLEAVDLLEIEKAGARASWNKLTVVDLQRIASLEDYRRSRFVSSSFQRLAEKSVGSAVERALLSAGIALERSRLKHGETPATLEGLVPEFLPAIPIDPADGRPLRYRRLPDGSPHVWSTWPSGKDEDGLPDQHRLRNTVWATGEVPALRHEGFDHY